MSTTHSVWELKPRFQIQFMGTRINWPPPLGAPIQSRRFTAEPVRESTQIKLQIQIKGLQDPLKWPANCFAHNGLVDFRRSTANAEFRDFINDRDSIFQLHIC